MISDGDGPYIPGVSDCTWFIAPPGATTLYLTFSSLVLGGADGLDPDQLQISVCKDLECLEPVDVVGSPFSKMDDHLKRYDLCAAHGRSKGPFSDLFDYCFQINWNGKTVADIEVLTELIAVQCSRQ